MKCYSALTEKEVVIYYNTVDLILSENNQSQKTSTIWFHLHEVSKLVTHRSSKYNGGCQGLGREGIGELLPNEYRIFFMQDEKSFRNLLYKNMQIYIIHAYR